MEVSAPSDVRERRRERGYTQRVFMRSLWPLLGLAALFGAAGSSPAQSRRTPDAPFELIEVRGAHPGPTLALVAGVHGGKVSATVALRRFLTTLDPSRLHGTLRVVPVANVAGYRAGLAQTHPEDGLNLNRVFPGRVNGSPTERIADQLMREIVAKSDYLVDLHGSDGEEAVGRFAYAARPGLDSGFDARALSLAEHCGAPRVVWDQEGPRTLSTSRFLQTAAHLSGVPAITVFEAGAERESPAAIAAFEAGLHRLLVHLGMLEGPRAPSHTSRYPRRVVTSAPTAGRWEPFVRPEQQVRSGEPLGLLVRSSGRDTLFAAVNGVILHQRLAGAVAAQQSLIILADDSDRREPNR